MSGYSGGDVITSRKNPYLLKIASLQDRKYREEYALFSIEGKKLVLEAISAGIYPDEIIFSEEKFDVLFPLIDSAYALAGMKLPSIIRCSRECFAKISAEKAPEGIIAVAKHLDFFKKSIKIDGRQIDSLFSRDERMLVLYDIRDPGNMGAVMRSALAFGIERIVLGGSCVDLYNPKTVRASMGAVFRLQYAFASDLSFYADSLRAVGRRLLAAELKDGARPLQSVGVNARDVL